MSSWETCPRVNVERNVISMMVAWDSNTTLETISMCGSNTRNNKRVYVQPYMYNQNMKFIKLRYYQQLYCRSMYLSCRCELLSHNIFTVFKSKYIQDRENYNLFSRKGINCKAVRVWGWGCNGGICICRIVVFIFYFKNYLSIPFCYSLLPYQWPISVQRYV